MRQPSKSAIADSSRAPRDEFRPLDAYEYGDYHEVLFKVSGVVIRICAWFLIKLLTIAEVLNFGLAVISAG